MLPSSCALFRPGLRVDEQGNRLDPARSYRDSAAGLEKAALGRTIGSIAAQGRAGRAAQGKWNDVMSVEQWHLFFQLLVAAPVPSLMVLIVLGVAMWRVVGGGFARQVTNLGEQNRT